MKIVQCKNGHFYDQQKHDFCPCCSNKDIIRQKPAIPVEIIQVKKSAIDNTETLSITDKLPAHK